MLTSRTASLARSALNKRMFSSSASRLHQVAVLGAGGGIGQPLSLLLKTNPLVETLHLYDIRGAPGVAADVSHIDTSSAVRGFTPEKLETALKGTEVVVIPAGVPRKPGMTRDDLFNTNAGIVRDLAKAIAEYAPKAHVLVISNPVNSTVPIVAEVFKKAGIFDPRKLYGITTLDVVRASQFTSSLVPGSSAETTVVPVVGGHSGVTIVPLLSQSAIGKEIQSGSEAWSGLVHRIQFGGDEVVQAKDGAGSATLSMAYAAAKFTNLLLRALKGEKGLVTPSFVSSPLFKDQGLEWFSSNVELGTEGVEKVHEIGAITPEEEALIQACLPELKKNIEKGEAFVANSAN